ncbi:MAG: AMP-binding protein [Actinomycetota bacterium]|nr:AMP-binding protein [Actinomycetota bacterium]MDA3018793.1 AMP-binding protein [Actinomycetota bacterium]
MTTVASLIRAREGDQHAGYIFEGRTYTWDEVVSESAIRASILNDLLADGRPPHVGILLENTPEYLFWIGGAALIGACIVGINPTRRGSELERDIQHTDCQAIISDETGMKLLAGLDTGVENVNTIDVDSQDHQELLTQHQNAPLPENEPDENSILFLLFTSGSTSAPKAVVCTNQRMAIASVRAGQIYGVTSEEVCYCPMPLFHGNALMACWGPALAVGATVVLRRKFSASNFISDIREHGCTYFTYVGRTIAYILGQPANADDKHNKLRLGFGTEASALDRERFLERFGCDLVEGYGSSESVVAIIRTPDTPANALGKERADMAGQVCIVDPDTNVECPRVRFDEFGAISNPECIGEIVSLSGGTSFEGYYNNREASTERVRNGWYWTGDLGYRDDDGFFYFGGRSADWLRVDSENFAAGPVENIVSRFPEVVMAAVYPVPDPTTGDMVMVAIEMTESSVFSPQKFDDFLSQQRDLGTKWSPQIVRVIQAMPLTANNKVHKPPLRASKWFASDTHYWRPERNQSLRVMSETDKQELEARFAANGRAHILSTL